MKLDRVSIDRDAGIPLGKVSAGAPVRRRATTIEEASLGEEKRARTHRGEAAHLWSDPAEPPNQRAIARYAARADASRHQ